MWLIYLLTIRCNIMQVSDLQQQNSSHLGWIYQIALTNEDQARVWTGGHTVTYFSLYVNWSLSVISDIAGEINGLFEDNASKDLPVILYRSEICWSQWQNTRVQRAVGNVGMEILTEWEAAEAVLFGTIIWKMMDGRTFCTHCGVELETRRKYWGWITWRWRSVWETGVTGMIILKLILEKKNAEIVSGLKWPKNTYVWPKYTNWS